jgi:hypothetical protein
VISITLGLLVSQMLSSDLSRKQLYEWSMKRSQCVRDLWSVKLPVAYFLINAFPILIFHRVFIFQLSLGFLACYNPKLILKIIFETFGSTPWTRDGPIAKSLSSGHASIIRATFILLFFTHGHQLNIIIKY